MIGAATSVVIATHNGGRRVTDAVASALQQGEVVSEVVIIDDGSTDDTWRTLKRLQPSDHRITLIRLPTNTGLYAARSAAISRTTGEFVALLDDDDRWMPGKLEQQLAMMSADPDVVLCHTGVIDVFPTGECQLRRGRDAKYRDLLWQDWVATSTVVLRKTAYEAAGGYDTRFRAFGDWDLWTRLARLGKLQYLDEATTLVEQRPGSIQRGSLTDFVVNRELAMQKRASELRREHLQRRAWSFHRYTIAIKHLDQGHRTRAAAYALRSLVTRPSPHALALLALLPWPGRQRTRLKLAFRQIRRRLAV